MLYEITPLVYIIVGTCATILLPEELGKASGVLLVSAAIMIIQMRLNYRQKKLDYLELIVEKFVKEKTDETQ
jgi:hypothetical protein